MRRSKSGVSSHCGSHGKIAVFWGIIGAVGTGRFTGTSGGGGVFSVSWLGCACCTVSGFSFGGFSNVMVAVALNLEFNSLPISIFFSVSTCWYIIRLWMDLCLVKSITSFVLNLPDFMMILVLHTLRQWLEHLFVLPTFSHKSAMKLPSGVLPKCCFFFVPSIGAWVFGP